MVMQKYLELNDNKDTYNILKLVETVNHFLRGNFIALNDYISEQVTLKIRNGFHKVGVTEISCS